MAKKVWKEWEVKLGTYCKTGVWAKRQDNGVLQFGNPNGDQVFLSPQMARRLFQRLQKEYA